MYAAARYPNGTYDNHLFRSQRDIEYEAFSRVTRDLVAAYKANSGADIISAVCNNNELWMVITSALADPANIIAVELRQSLIALARFSLQTGREYMRQGGDIQVLIDINISIMKGLRGVPQP